MLIYWTMFVTPLLASTSPFRLNRVGRRVLTLLAGLLLALVIGAREEVGCDWGSYLEHFYATQGEDLAYALTTTDPAYAFVNWLSALAGLQIHTVNTVCAVIFVTGLFLFCRRQPAPLLAAVVAIPYLVVVVSMGYTRQATAVGLLMIAFNAFTDGRRWLFLLFVVAAASFHRSAIMFAPLVAFVTPPGELRRWRPQRAFAMGAGAVASSALLAVFIGGHIEQYSYAYVESEYRAAGDVYRIALNSAAGLIFLIFRRRWRDQFGDAKLYAVLALASVATIPLMAISSVGADRLSLYLIPLQIAAFSRLPLLLPGRLRLAAKAGVGGAYAAVLFVWLQFADHAYCWVPYDSALF